MAALVQRLRKEAASVRRARQRAIKPPRFGADQQVDRATARRTMSRMRRLGDRAPSLSIYKGGITGAEARGVKGLLAESRPDRRKTFSTEPVRTGLRGRLRRPERRRLKPSERGRVKAYARY